VRDGAVQAREESRRSQTPDLSAEATTAGGYSASFGGYVIQGNVGADHDLPQGRSRKHSTDDWVTRFRAARERTIPARDERRRAVDGSRPAATNSRSTSSWPTSSAATRRRRAKCSICCGDAGRDERQQFGNALAPEVSVEFDRTKMQALDVSLGSAAAAAGAAFGGDVATQFETPQGLEQVQVIYPLDDQHRTRVAQGRSRSARTAATSCTSATSRLQEHADLAAGHAHRPQYVIHVDANFAPGRRSRTCSRRSSRSCRRCICRRTSS
jgi:multidrug efflux pump subunit AcrB